MSGLDYALGLGLPCFPCWNCPRDPEHDKTPLTRNGFKDASDDPAKIRGWFSGTRNPLIGVPTGAASGFDVLDIDPRHGGQLWLEANRRHLPETRVHQTRSGGQHWLFAAHPKLRCSTSKIAPG